MLQFRRTVPETRRAAPSRPALARAMSAADARARDARDASPDAPAPPSDPDSALNVAARAADWHRVEQLLNDDGAAHAPDAWTAAACARCGNLAMLTMLVETHACAWDEKTATEAIEGEHWDCARYAARAGALGRDGGALTTAACARKGALDQLRWMRERGVAWDASTCWSACFNGHLHVLIWARENGCPWDTRVVTESAKKGYIGCLTYALDHDAPMPQGGDMKRLIKEVNKQIENENRGNGRNVVDEDARTYEKILKLLEPEDPVMEDLQGVMSFIEELAEHAPEGAYIENCARAQRIWMRLKDVTSKVNERERRRNRRHLRELLNDAPDAAQLRGLNG